MPRWPPPPLRQRRPLLRKPAAHEATTAAAAANKQHALDARAPSEKSDLPKEPGGGVEIMDGEDFSGGERERDGGHSTTTLCRGATVVAAPRHVLRLGHFDGLWPSAFARASTRRIPRLYIRGRACIKRDICLVF